MKVQIKKKEFCRILNKTDFIESYSSSKMPDFIELDAEPVGEKCVHTWSQPFITLGLGGFSESCSQCGLTRDAADSPIIKETTDEKLLKIVKYALEKHDWVRLFKLSGIFDKRASFEKLLDEYLQTD